MQRTAAEQLADNIRAALGARAVTVTWLADQLGVHKSTLYRRFDGTGDPWTYEDLVKVSDLLGVPIATITDGVEALVKAQIREAS